MARSANTPLEILKPRLGLLLCSLALLLIGLVMVYSSSSIIAITDGEDAASYVLDQLLYAGLGIVAALFIWKFLPPHIWQGPFIFVVWGVAVALLIATFLSGLTGYGATRWLSLGPVGIQPSEFAKIAFLLVAARLLDDYRNGRLEPRQALVAAIVGVLIPLVFLYRTQSDLGTTLICAVGIMAVLWLGEVPLRTLLTAVAIVVVFALAAIFLTGYRSDRLVFLDPWNDGKGGLDAGYNIIRSFYAFAEGGLFGVGLGNSHEKYQYLFASESDFIFAIIGEELGMIGALAVIALFLAFLLCGLRIADQAPTQFAGMLAGGFTIMIVGQAFLNIGCTIGVFPTTGKPLPFISSGGSSLIATLMMVGIILSVSKEAANPSVHEQRRNNLRVVRSNTTSAPPRANAPRPVRPRAEAPRATSRRGGDLSLVQGADLRPPKRSKRR